MKYYWFACLVGFAGAGVLAAASHFWLTAGALDVLMLICCLFALRANRDERRSGCE